MSSRRRTYAGRDQDASAFSAALMRLCDGVGALGAALVDSEGEAVDYAGDLDPFDIKIAAAELCVILAELRRSKVPYWAETEELLIRGSARSYYAHMLGEGYAVVLELLPHAFGVSRRGMLEAIRELCKESGLTLPRSATVESERWTRVDVRCPRRPPRRPEAIWVNGAWCELSVLGSFKANPTRREFGYRARLATGAEITLVREALGRWYADMVPDQK